MKISICIPTHEMQGKGPEFLEHSLGIISNQSFKDFEVVVSDNSENNEIKKVCEKFFHLQINYFRNPRKGMAPNTNEAIKASKGELIKILYLDDYLYGKDALKDIVETFRPKDNWLVSACVHTYDGEKFVNPHWPNYHQKIYEGGNTIGSPSVLTIRNEGKLLFDEGLTWVLDCELYKRYHDAYGLPRCLNTPNVVIRIGDHQVTNILPEEIKRREIEYSIKKHE